MNRICILVFAFALLLSGCGGGDSTVDPGTPNVQFASDLTSSMTRLRELNGGTKTIGWNLLEGTTTGPDGEAANVEMLGNVDYVNGDGDFFGFLTLSTANYSLTMRMDGLADRNPTTGNTAFTSKLTVLGGTGTYNNASGSGEFTGHRDSALGGLVHIDVKVTVK